MVANPLLDEQRPVCGAIINGRDISDRKRNEEELRASDETLRAISDTALDALILMDASGRVGHWNSAAERMFGFTREEIMGRDLHQFLAPPHYREPTRKRGPLSSALARGTRSESCSNSRVCTRTATASPSSSPWPVFDCGANGARSASSATSPSASGSSSN